MYVEELRIYLDLVEQLGDPFTVFERDWPEADEQASGPHVSDAEVPTSFLFAPPPPNPMFARDFGFPG